MSNPVTNSTQSTQAADSKREDNHSIVSPSSLSNDKFPPCEQPADNDNNRRTKRHFASGLTRHYQNTFPDQSMRCGVFKVFYTFGKTNTLQELLIEDDYDYPQTYLFVEKVLQTLNDQYDLSLSLNSEEYQLFFAKKNGTRNTSYPEIDLVNTNLQKAMKCYEKNTLLLQKRHTETIQDENVRLSLKQQQQQYKENKIKNNDGKIEDDSIDLIGGSSESLCAKKKANKQILMYQNSTHRRSALTDIQSYRQDNNKQSIGGKQQQQQQQNQSCHKSSNSSSIFSCFSLCSTYAD